MAQLDGAEVVDLLLIKCTSLAESILIFNGLFTAVPGALSFKTGTAISFDVSAT